MKTLSPIVFAGAIANVAASAILWRLAPTDSVRVWYPTLFAYVGEHFMFWAVLVMVATSVRRVQGAMMGSVSSLSSAGATLLVVFGADLVASIFLREIPKSVWLDPLLPYLEFRVPAFTALLLACSGVWWFGLRRARSG